MSITAIAAFAIVAAFISVILRNQRPEFSLLIGLGASALIIFTILQKTVPIIEELNNLFCAVNISGEFSSVIFKAIGICIIVQIASDTCRDAGESSLASKIEIAGKITIIFMSLPLLSKVLNTAAELISQGEGM